jgi:membrane-associated phospholipid phosphatase
MKKLTIICQLFLWAFAGFTQSPYVLDWKKDLVLNAVGGAKLGLGFYLEDETTLFTPDELLTLDPDDVNPIDRVATGFHPKKAHRTSNYFFFSSAGLPALLMLGKETRHDARTLVALWGETLLLTGGITHLCKHSFRRPRPYVFDKNKAISIKTTTNAKASFLSGHTSITAANAFLAAKVFSDYYPESDLKPFIWGVAATVPAVTGYLRVRAGRHYPTDTIAGYAVGALIGWGVPQLHRSKAPAKSGLSFNVGMDRVELRWKW